jgi:N-acetylmuramoyl-L-alanine amidase
MIKGILFFGSDYVKKTAFLQFIIITLVAVLIITLDVSYYSVFKGGYASAGSRVIIIDAGHGGMDGGAVGNNTGVLEKNINLSIAKKLKGYLEQQGDTCIMIREVDEGLYSEEGTIRQKYNENLRNRKEIIKENKADLFISVHLNHFPQAQYYGAQVFYLKGDDNSKRLGRIAQEELIKVLGRDNKRVEKPSDSYYMLNNNKVPSIIVECGFLSNPEEEKLLSDSEYQNKIAWAIYSGIMRYFSETQNMN